MSSIDKFRADQARIVGESVKVLAAQTAAENAPAPVSKFRQVIAEYVATLPASERDEAATIISLEAGRETNQVGGRPSDCARGAVAAHKRGDLTPESFRTSRENDPNYLHYSA